MELFSCTSSYVQLGIALKTLESSFWGKNASPCNSVGAVRQMSEMHEHNITSVANGRDIF